jgi:SAM-dependent methyltransferase
MDEWQRDLRDGYDRVAAAYTARVSGELAHKPLDRQLLDRFAALVGPVGTACDLGCGPGHVARYLHERGLSVVGVDLSPEMVAQARMLNPSLSFREGTMLALDFPNSALGGIVAFYSIIHIRRELLPRAFSEMWRTLRPGGVLLLGFHVGDETLHLDDWLGEKVAIDFYFFDPAEVERHLIEAGFTVEERIEREPYPDVEAQTRRAYLLARWPRT